MTLTEHLRQRKRRIRTMHELYLWHRRNPKRLPPRVDINLEDRGVRNYWLARSAQHYDDTYLGIRMSKMPEDLRVYEHLLWLTGATVIIELGAQFGGSTLWFRDRLVSMGRYRSTPVPRIISIDINIDAARHEVRAVDPAFEDTIVFIGGNVLDPELPRTVARHIPPGSSCFVIEDTAHTYETTTAALSGFASFVPAGGFFVVEDGSVDIEAMRPVGPNAPHWPRGVLPAIQQWLASPQGRCFSTRRDFELYGLSAHPCGFLQRTALD